MRSCVILEVFAIILIPACRTSVIGRVAVRTYDSPVRIVLLQNSYWGGGFDRPLFVGYSNGTVLFPTKRKHGIPVQYAAAHLTRARLDTLLHDLGTDALYDLDSLYDFAPRTTDQHSFYVVLPKDSGFKLVQIRAGLRDSENLDQAVPAPFKHLYSRLHKFSPSGAVPWTPDSLEVSIWPYEYAPDDPPVGWPPTWPGLDSPRWSRHPDPFVSEVRTVRFPFTFSRALDSLLSIQHEKQAIGVSGKKWAMAYRWVFPNEEEWQWIGHRLEY